MTEGGGGVRSFERERKGEKGTERNGERERQGELTDKKNTTMHE